MSSRIATLVKHRFGQKPKLDQVAQTDKCQATKLEKCFTSSEMQVSSGFFRWFSNRPNDLLMEEWLVRNSLLQKMSTFVDRSVEGSHRRRRGRGRSFSSAAPPPPPPPPPLPPYPCSPAKEVNLICHHQNSSLLKSHSENPPPPQRLCIPSIIMLHYFPVFRPPSL